MIIPAPKCNPLPYVENAVAMNFHDAFPGCNITMECLPGFQYKNGGFSHQMICNPDTLLWNWATGDEDKKCYGNAYTITYVDRISGNSF